MTTKTVYFRLSDRHMSLLASITNRTWSFSEQMRAFIREAQPSTGKPRQKRVKGEVNPLRAVRLTQEEANRLFNIPIRAEIERLADDI